MRTKTIILVCASLIVVNHLGAQSEAFTCYGNPKAIVYDICFSKGGTMLVVPENNIVSIYNTETRGLMFQLKGGHANTILSVDMSTDSSYIATGGKDGLVIIWNVKTKEIYTKHQLHKDAVTTVKFHPKKNIVASGSADNKVLLYDFEEKKLVHQFSEHTGDISSLSFNSYGNLLASTGEDKKIIFWDTEIGDLVNALNVHRNYIRSVSFSEDNTKLISCDDDSRVLIWRVNNVEEVKILRDEKCRAGWLLTAAFHPEAKTFLYAGLAGKVELVSPFCKNKYKVKKTVHKVLFKPNTGSLVKLAIATRGNGVLLLDTSKY